MGGACSESGKLCLLRACAVLLERKGRQSTQDLTVRLLTLVRKVRMTVSLAVR